MSDAHLPYVWAAYRRGALGDAFPEGLTVHGFKKAMIEGVRRFALESGEVFVLIGRTPKGPIPLALVGVRLFQDHAYPHVEWFPEASARNRLECGLNFLIALKKIRKCIITARLRDARYFDHLGKYGAVRRVGTLRADKDGEDMALYETVGNGRDS